jgi:hypothetical protein
VFFVHPDVMAGASIALNRHLNKPELARIVVQTDQSCAAYVARTVSL